MGKNVGLTYVKDFTFPAEQGFTGSAGVHKVKGYMRGGHVKSKAHQKMPANVKMKGGEVHAGEGGYYGKPGDKYPTLKSGPRGKQGSSMPKNVKNRGGSVHDKLKHEGAKMGYAYGGTVKKTSADFVMKKGKQDTMDHGVQPAQTGRNQAEVEAGGNKRLKAGYNEGGGVHRTRYKKGGTAKKKSEGEKGYKGAFKGMTGQISEAERAKIKQLLKESGKIGLRRDLLEFLGITRRKPIGAAAVKAHLGALKGRMSDAERKHMEKSTAKKSHGGPATTPGKAKAMGLHKSASRRARGTTRSAEGGLAKYSHGGAARKPYTGYNKQPGGSGNEDERYMRSKK